MLEETKIVSNESPFYRSIRFQLLITINSVLIVVLLAYDYHRALAN